MMDQFTLGETEDQVRLKTAWEQALRRLEPDMAETAVKRFLRPLSPVSLGPDSCVFDAPGQFIHDWVMDKYVHMLEPVLSEELGRNVTITLRVRPRARTEMGVATASVAVATPVVDAPLQFRPSERYRFETLVVGASNRMAVAGAKAVAAAPGTKYNPLFIYGVAGIGKTHMLHAIASEILARDPHYPVKYVSAQAFMEDFISALQGGRIDQFRREQRNVEVWLLDDVQLIAGKDRTQEEVFHTFNHLYTLGRQVVLCADRAPRDLLLMDERLRSRLESGLVVDVQMPDTETRCAILQGKAQRDGIPLDHSVAMYLAESVPGNVRILEGALTRIAAFSSLEGMPLDRALAESVVEKYYQNVGTAKPSFEQILESVSKHFRIPLDDIKGISRKAPIAHARHVAVFMTREITQDSWKHIGALFGNRDHTSMMHGYKKIRDLMNRDRDLNATVRMLMRDLYPDV